MVKWRPKLTSLLRVEERLLEANYFVVLMRGSQDREKFGYCLNAFVSAARSVTFLIQKEMSRVPGFSVWWGVQQQMLGEDSAARFFLKLRNYSQKEGRISLVGTRVNHGRRRRWSYRFAGNVERVPPELLQRDVAECCAEHVAKLARLTLACTEQFPFNTCPRRALTPEGLEVLGLSISELGALLGFPSEWFVAGEAISLDHQLRILRQQVDGLDFDVLKRLTRRRVRKLAEGPGMDRDLGDELATHLVTQLEGEHHSVDIPTLAATLIPRGMEAQVDSAPNTTSDSE